MSFAIGVETLTNFPCVIFYLESVIRCSEHEQRFAYLRSVSDFSQQILAILRNDHGVESGPRVGFSMNELRKVVLNPPQQQGKSGTRAPSPETAS